VRLIQLKDGDSIADIARVNIVEELEEENGISSEDA